MMGLKKNYKTVFIFTFLFIAVFLLIAIIINNSSNDHTHINPDPVIVGTCKLEEIPNKAFYCDDIYFLSSDKTLKKVQIENNKLVYSVVAKNVLDVYYSPDHFVLMYDDGKIEIRNHLDGYELVNGKFADAVFEYAKKSPILKIVPSEAFDNTMVLFEDGTLYSTINYMRLSEITDNEQFYFKVFDDVSIVDIASGHEEYVFDSDNYIHSSFNVKKIKWTDGTLIDHSNRMSINDKGSVFFIAENNFEKLDEYFSEPIVDLEGGCADATLALSNSNKLYHIGYSYVEETDCLCLPSVFPPEVVYESDEIKHFFSSSYGIVVILEDGTMEIIQN